MRILRLPEPTRYVLVPVSVMGDGFMPSAAATSGESTRTASTRGSPAEKCFDSMAEAAGRDVHLTCTQGPKRISEVL